jgi:hypothetical protein
MSVADEAEAANRSGLYLGIVHLRIVGSRIIGTPLATGREFVSSF